MQSQIGIRGLFRWPPLLGFTSVHTSMFPLPARAMQKPALPVAIYWIIDRCYCRLSPPAPGVTMLGSNCYGAIAKTSVLGATLTVEGLFHGAPRVDFHMLCLR